MIRRPPRSTQSRSSAASDVYKRQARAPLAASVRRRRPCPEGTPTSPARRRARPPMPSSKRPWNRPARHRRRRHRRHHLSRCPRSCLLYTSDAADDLLCVDLGGRRIIKKKKEKKKKRKEKKKER